MQFREAIMDDLEGIMEVRWSVKENRLSDPSVVTLGDCEDYIFRRGKGWVCEVDGKIVGFAIADLADYNIWALFIHPDWERRGIGRKLQKLMLDWYFSQTKHTVWLSTDPKSRAAGFYRKSGWNEMGLDKKGELRFEMDLQTWIQR